MSQRGNLPYRQQSIIVNTESVTGRGAEWDSSTKRDLARLRSVPDASKRDLACLQELFISKLEGVQ